MAEYLGEMPTFQVLPENWETVRWFLILENRWLIGPGGGYMRIDDQAIHAQMSLRGVTKKRRIELLDGLMIMERAALKLLNADTSC